MKSASVTSLLLLILLCSCNPTKSTIAKYHNLVNELKNNSAEYTEADWESVAKRYETLEDRALQCRFSTEERKELNRLRGQCVAYMLKGAIYQMGDVMEQVSDMTDGFGEAFGEAFNEESVDKIIDDYDRIFEGEDFDGLIDEDSLW